MSNKITELTAASTIQDEDSFVLEQEGQAMRLPGEVLRRYAENSAKEVAEDVWENLPQSTNCVVKRVEQTITISLTLEGGVTSQSVITLDDNDYPISILTDGVNCPISWEGFDE